MMALDVPRLPTGSTAMDEALGGGFPLQRPSLIWGRNDSYKSILLMKLAAQAQHRSLKVGWIDVDRKFKPELAIRIGVDLSDLHATQCNGISEAKDALVVASSICDITFFDSLAGLLPNDAKNEVEQELNYDSSVKSMLRLCFRKSVIMASTSKVVESMDPAGFEYLPGCHHQRSVCSVIMKVWRGPFDSMDGTNRLFFNVEKNSTYAPRNGTSAIYFGRDEGRQFASFVS